MRHLRDLDLRIRQWPPQDDVDSFQTDHNVLPLDYGPDTLRSLSLIYECSFGCNEAFQKGLLDRFTNLTSLFVHPLSNELCNYLSRANVQLEQFRTIILGYDEHLSDPTPAIDIENFITMLSSPSLRTLRELRIIVDCNDLQLFHDPRILEVICENTQSVEELVLGLTFDTSWCLQIQRLQKLKLFHWYVPVEDYYDSLNAMKGLDQLLLFPESRRLVNLVGRRLARHLYISAFQHFVRQPTVRVDILSRVEYRDLCEWEMGPSVYAG